ncbi:cellulase family glycosylhydrolase [Streptacidiphilus jiangxiensis]|uniref:Endoglycosylceramidase n=1 Tax=Streptacidiphilus jiangxiensis TaxID=235985 RepID=A0A1H8AR94_STRJI|nr:cellulase family glycosylhydrolase [Streptacidiphilus jiangxiensis]SEM73250.1 endoglycosylceramidase [Streptacidiphilus jiangxiensis]
MRARLLAGAVALVAALSTAPLSTAAAAPRHDTAPVALTDGHGRVLGLRGFNVDKYDETSPADIRAIAAQGFDLIRLDITWARLEPRRGRYDEAQFSKLRQLMDAADRYGLRVVVDFHQDVFGPKYGGGQDGVPVWATRDDGLPFVANPNDWFAGYFQPAVQRAFQHLYDDADLRRDQDDFYAHVAREFRGHRSLLGYDLFNEPSGPIAGDPTDPAVQIAASAALERGRLAAMYRRLIGAVRSVDSSSWLFVEPTVLVGEGVPTQLPGFTDPRHGAARIGYAPHFYDTNVENGQDWNPADGFVQNYVAAIGAYPQAHRMPVLVGEWGPPNADTPGNTELVSQQVSAMRQFAAGWTMWYWGKGVGGYTPLGPDGKPHPGDAPVFAPYARELAGTLLGESYDAATRTYTLRYRASAATTRIVLPPSVYADGASIAVTGRSRIELRQPHAGWYGTAEVSAPRGAVVTVTVTGL